MPLPVNEQFVGLAAGATSLRSPLLTPVQPHLSEMPLQPSAPVVPRFTPSAAFVPVVLQPTPAPPGNAPAPVNLPWCYGGSQPPVILRSDPGPGSFFFRSYQLTPVHDALFLFAVTRSSATVNADGSPALTLQLTFGLQQFLSAAVFGPDGKVPANCLEAVQFIASAPTLSLTANDSTGAAQTTTYNGSAVLAGDTVTVSFPGLTGYAVVVAFASLRLTGSAVLTLTTSYHAYGAIPGIRFGPRLCSRTYPLPLGMQYAADTYLSSYTLTDGTATRPILSVEDLRQFSPKESEYLPLADFGDIQTRFPSVAALYYGVLSRTVVALPQTYCLCRDLNGPLASCRAVIDSASGAAHFEFDFTLAPAFDPIEWAELGLLIGQHPATHDCTLTSPQLIDASGCSFASMLQTTASFAQGGAPHTYLSTLVLADGAGGLPAVANANLLIRLLCLLQPPYLSGTISVRLDDIAPPIAVAAVFAFQTTIASTHELTATLDPTTFMLSLANGSARPLQLQRYALITDGAVTGIYPDPQVLAPQAVLKLPIPTGSVPLLIADAQLLVADPVSARALLHIDALDVQNIRCTYGLNGGGLDWSGSGFASLDVLISFVDDRIQPVTLTLTSGAAPVQATTSILLENVLAGLQATLLFTPTYTSAPASTDAFAPMQVNFIVTPIVLLPSRLPLLASHPAAPSA